MHWVRGKTLRTGDFAFVSLATTLPEIGDAIHLSPVVAVKSADISHAKSLLKEKELLNKFRDCPCILRCFGDDITTEKDQLLYNILLEYASGGCLADHLAGKSLPEHTVRNYTRSILTALIHIHKHGYVHCDIKPQNVLLQGSNSNSAKLADFGSCKRRAGEGGGENEDQQGFTGTVLYAAPESITRQEYLPESDVWALGCTVLQMLTGKSPWKIGKDAAAKDVMMMIGCSNRIPEIPTGKKVTKEARDFLMKCFVKDPKGRWKAEMLLEHPFIAGSCSSQHHISSKLSHAIYSLMPHCFHLPKTGVVHAC